MASSLCDRLVRDAKRTAHRPSLYRIDHTYDCPFPERRTSGHQPACDIAPRKHVRVCIQANGNRDIGDEPMHEVLRLAAERRISRIETLALWCMPIQISEQGFRFKNSVWRLHDRHVHATTSQLSERHVEDRRVTRLVVLDTQTLKHPPCKLAERADSD